MIMMMNKPIYNILFLTFIKNDIYNIQTNRNKQFLKFIQWNLKDI